MTDKPTKAVKEEVELKTFYSPGVGNIEAKDFEEAVDQISRLKEPEVGDVNN